ncbi:exonuclease SbcCD subunit D [Pimelobacter simplex]|uniref:exonuclease SbcCD subunit D n=1 Tax=Nocardioides simplex TaxID=2045 RepID=UPI003AAE5DFC
MKFLHTSDWHVGKTLKGRPRIDEHRAVLREIVGHARAHAVDAVLIAGDIYDSSNPGAEAQQLVVRTLLTLAQDGIEVIAIAGNHDHGATFEAYRPVMGVAGIHVYGQARARDKGGVHSFRARSTDEPVNVAVIPFLSQRYAVRAAQLIAPGDNVPARNVGSYDQWVRNIVTHLAEGYDPDGVNVMTAHVTCTGGAMGGGERAAQSIFEYHVPAGIFPIDSHYVALGHLHRRQELAAQAPVHYAGSPLAVDFGEQENTPTVLLVEATPGLPARVSDLVLTSPRRLRTVEGDVEQLRSAADACGDDWLRVRVKQHAYAGLREDILEALPNALEIHVHPEFAQTGTTTVSNAQIAAKSPADLFADYCAHVGRDDERVRAMFNAIHDDLTAGR